MNRVVIASAVVAGIVLTVVLFITWQKIASDRSPRELATEARAAFERGADLVAERLFSTALEAEGLGPQERARYLIERARCRMRQSKLSDAMSDLNSAVELDSGSVAALHERGGLYRRMRELESSVGDLSRAVELAPRDVDVMNDYAITLMELHRAVEAKSALMSALKLDPQNWRVNFNLGRLHHESGNSVMASEAFERALASNPTEGAIYVEFARMLSHGGEEEAALGKLADGIAAAATYAPLRLAYAASLMKANRLAECEEQCNVALSLDSALWNGYFARGICRDLSGRLDAAIEDLEHSLKLNPGRIATLVKIADVYDRRGNTHAAMGFMARAARDSEHLRDALAAYPKARRDQLESLVK